MRILNPNSFVLRLYLRVHVFVSDLLARRTKSVTLPVLSSTRHGMRLVTPRPQRRCSGTRGEPPAHLASDEIELADEGIALREHDVCVGRWCPGHGRCVHISSPKESVGGCWQNFRRTIPSSPGLCVPHEWPSLLPILEVPVFPAAQMLNRTAVTWKLMAGR